MLKNIKKSLATKLSLFISFFILLAFIVLGSVTVIKVRNYNRTTIIERSDSEINSMLQITANINSVMMQQLRTYTMFVCSGMKDPIEIQKVLVKYNKKRYKDFISVSYIDYRTGLQYNDDGTTTDVVGIDYYHLMKNQLKQNKGQQLYSDIHKSNDPKNPYWYAICKDSEVKDGAGFPVGFFMGKTSVSYIQRFVDKLRKENSFEYKDGFFAILNTYGQYVCAPEKDRVGKNIFSSSSLSMSSKVVSFIHSPVDRIGKDKVTITGEATKNGKKYSVTVGMFTKTHNWILMIVTPYSTIDQMSDKLLFTIIIVSAVSAVLLLLISVLVLTKSFIPLEVLNLKMNEMSKQNVDLTKRLEITSNDEIGQLEKSFNKYLQQLQVMVSDLKSSKESLISSEKEIEAVLSKMKSLLKKKDSDEKEAEIDILDRKSSKEFKIFYSNINDISKEIDDFKV